MSCVKKCFYILFTHCTSTYLHVFFFFLHLILSFLQEHQLCLHCLVFICFPYLSASQIAWINFSIWIVYDGLETLFHFTGLLFSCVFSFLAASSFISSGLIVFWPQFISLIQIVSLSLFWSYPAVLTSFDSCLSDYISLSSSVTVKGVCKKTTSIPRVVFTPWFCSSVV